MHKTKMSKAGILYYKKIDYREFGPMSSWREIDQCFVCRRKAPEDGISKQSPDLRPRSSENLSGSRNNLVSGGATQLQGQVRR